MPKQQTNKGGKQKDKLITNLENSELYSKYADNVPDYMTDTTYEQNNIDSSEPSTIQEEFDDPVIRATIQKFNNELANEDNDPC